MLLLRLGFGIGHLTRCCFERCIVLVYTALLSSIVLLGCRCGIESHVCYIVLMPEIQFFFFLLVTSTDLLRFELDQLLIFFINREALI